MKKISIVGVLVESADWILHPIKNYKELQQYREDYEKEVVGVGKQIGILEFRLQAHKVEYYKLEDKYEKTKNNLADCKKEAIIKDKQISEMKATIRSLEQKVIYRNNVINTLRKTKIELKYQIGQLERMLDEARNEIIALAKKVEFYEKQNKKTPREKIDYTLMKRSKKSD